MPLLLHSRPVRVPEAALLHTEAAARLHVRSGCSGCLDAVCAHGGSHHLPGPSFLQRVLAGKGVGTDAAWAVLLSRPLFAGASDGGSASLGHLMDIWVERQHLLWKVGLLGGRCVRFSHVPRLPRPPFASPAYHHLDGAAAPAVQGGRVGAGSTCAKPPLHRTRRSRACLRVLVHGQHTTGRCFCAP